MGSHALAAPDARPPPDRPAQGWDPVTVQAPLPVVAWTKKLYTAAGALLTVIVSGPAPFTSVSTTFSETLSSTNRQLVPAGTFSVAVSVPARLVKLGVNEKSPCLAALPVKLMLPVLPTPVPLRLAICAPFAALLVTVNVPVRAPAAVGANRTEIVQVPPLATDVPQLLVWEKSPLTTMLLIVSVPSPAFRSVTLCAALVVPIFSVPNARLLGVSVAFGICWPPPIVTATRVDGMPLVTTASWLAPD